MPLEYNYDPRSFHMDAYTALPEDTDFNVPACSDSFCAKYSNLHPFTFTFIKRFGLDDKLFKQREGGN